MKGKFDRKYEIGGEHLVPLTPQVITALKSLWPLTGEGPLLFPSARGLQRPMSENALGYPTGSRIFVTIANFQPFAGQVVWQRNEQGGVLFDAPLHAAIVHHIRELWADSRQQTAGGSAGFNFAGLINGWDRAPGDRIG